MKVLIAVDGSVHALEAAKVLATLPLPKPLSIDLVTVVNPPDVVLSAQSDLWYPQFIEHQEDYSQAALDAAKQAVSKTDAEISTHQLSGHIGHRLVEYADEQAIDLVVVAAKGHSALERVLLGSVSDYVATHAHCSVLVVRPEISVDDQGQPVADPSQPSQTQLHTITVAVDQRDVSDDMIDWLCRFDWNEQHRFHVVTASVKLEVFREDILVATLEEAARRRSEAKHCAEAAAERILKTHTQSAVNATGVEVEHVGEGLVSDAESHGSDLVVMGDSQRGAVSRFLLGSTSRYVLRHVHCSVMIVRDHATTTGPA